ncbi:hypothetical protein HJG60_010617 [Phyllostomus discolor]|uniref:Uncharacterized protein n=1 Tax=Phyllostomus discolor TaxID=89673 RepID=A0A834ANG8_9CHIR|nr:hypothetical protein HJG60_010617 [Phyllostomus discolor]
MKTELDFFHSEMDKDDTLGAWGQSFISSSINLTTPQLPMHGFLEMLFSQLCERTPFPLVPCGAQSVAEAMACSKNSFPCIGRSSFTCFSSMLLPVCFSVLFLPLCCFSSRSRIPLNPTFVGVGLKLGKPVFLLPVTYQTQ